MKLATYTILPLLTFAPFLVNADVPPVDRIGVPAVVVCKLGQGNPIRAVHMDKIIFRITDELDAVLDEDQAALNAVPKNSKLDIKVLDRPTTVADLKGKVLTFLHATDDAANRAAILIDDVDYAVVCTEVPQPAGD